jgi:lipopolysaccharide export system permease protein
MFKLIDRYIFKEILVPFWLTLGTLMLVLLTDQMLRLVELLINKGVGILAILRVLMVITPPFLVLSIPAGVLIGVIIAYNRLSSDSEIIALQSGGFSLLRLLVPAAFFSVLAFAVTFILSVWSHPWSGRPIRNLGIKLLRDQVSVALEPGQFNEPVKDMVIFIEETPSPGTLKGILIHDLRDPQWPTLTLAGEGAIINTPGEDTFGFLLRNGNQYRYSRKDPGRSQQIRFASYEFKMDFGNRGNLAEEIGDQPDPDQLIRAIADHPEKAPRYRSLLVEYYKNFAFPLSCLIFAFVGVPAGITFRRTGRMGGFAVGLLLGTGYYFLLFMADYLGAAGKIAPVAAAWLPNILMGSVAVVAVVESHRGADWLRKWMGKT